jgi:cob(I)alamin adenosyltransferase
MRNNKFNREGLTHIYFDKKTDKYSNVALGILCRAIGHNLKITYINMKKHSFEIIYSFRKYLLKNVSFFDYNSFELKYLGKKDLIIFDNFDFEKFSLKELDYILNNREKNTEIVFVFSNKKEFNLVKGKFDLISNYVYKTNKEGRENLTNVYGNGKGKSTYCFGCSIRKIINKKNAKIIYFDKGGDFYGEKYFFDKLNKTNNNFNYKSFGLSRIENESFRFENFSDDFKEAKKGLYEIKNSFKHNFIVADELNTTINNFLIDENDILEVLKESDKKILISGRGASEKILDICKNLIEVREEKHYFNEGFGTRKGIDL